MRRPSRVNVLKRISTLLLYCIVFLFVNARCAWRFFVRSVSILIFEEMESHFPLDILLLRTWLWWCMEQDTYVERLVRAMTVTWKSLYDMIWLWPVLLILGGILLLKSNDFIKDSLVKWLVLFFIFGWIVYHILPLSQDGLRGVLVDLVQRAYLLLMNVELLWTEFHVMPTQTLVMQAKEGGQSENKQQAPKSSLIPTIPLTYKLRFVYSCTAAIFLVWLLLGLAFLHP